MNLTLYCEEFAVFAAVTAAMNSASVELRMANDYVFDLQSTALPEYVNTWRIPVLGGPKLAILQTNICQSTVFF